MSHTFPNPYSPYISFNIGTDFSLVWSNEDNRYGRRKGPDYFVSLSHKRIIGKANTGKMTISYTPMHDESPDFIENAIARAQGQCDFKYGILGQVSNTYRGIITGYSVSFSGGTITYTLDILSQAVLFNGRTIDNDQYDLPSKEDIINGRGKKLKGIFERMTEFVGTMMDMYKHFYDMINTNKSSDDDNKDKDSDDDKDTPKNAEEILTKDPTDYVFTLMEIIVNQFMDGYEFDRAHSVSDFDVANHPVEVTGCNAMKALMTIADSLTIAGDSEADVPAEEESKDKDQDDLSSGEARAEQLDARRQNNSTLSSAGRKSFVFYKIVVNDAVSDGGNGKITLQKVDCISSDEKSVSLEYEFEWGSMNSDIISWNPQFNGTYTIFTLNTPENKQYFNQKYYNDNNAEGVSYEVYMNVPISLGVDKDSYSGNEDRVKLQESVLRDTQAFCENANYPYKATLTVLGASDKKITSICESYVSVIPMVNGRMHHSGGVYQVVGIEDNVSGDGFTTKLDLVRSCDLSEAYIASKRQFYYDSEGKRHSIYSALQPLVYKSIEREVVGSITPGTTGSPSIPQDENGCYYYTVKSGTKLGDYTFKEDYKVLIVNKSYPVPKDYNSSKTEYFNKSLTSMMNMASSNGCPFSKLSGYRSYSEQDGLYNGKYAGDSNRDNYSARPGHSEHQTGLAADVGSIDYSFGNTSAGKWIKAHCAEYGFIIRYPDGTKTSPSKYTGFSAEPWHIRYIGNDEKGLAFAKYVMSQEGKSIEELFGIPSSYNNAAN